MKVKYCERCHKVYKYTDDYCPKCKRPVKDISLEEGNAILNNKSYIENKKPLYKSPAFWTWVISLSILLCILMVNKPWRDEESPFFTILLTLLASLFPTYLVWIFTLPAKEKERIDKINKMNDQKNQLKQQEKHASTHGAECPYCHSTDTQKISGMSRAGSIVVWGIFSKKLGKQWHCNKCGSDF